MKLDLSNELDRNKAITRFKQLLANKSKIELKKINPPRSIPQNSYLHACISLFAIEIGYSLAEAKDVLKRECGFMHYEKDGYVFLTSTASLDTAGMNRFIDWIRNYAGTNGIYIPTSEEFVIHQFDIQRQIEQNEKFL